MIVGIADTHTIIWYLSKDKRLSVDAENFINQAAKQGDQIGIASITLVELVYLIERYRIPVESFSSLAEEMEAVDSIFLEIPLALPIVRTLARINSATIPEMPDRIIASTGLYHNVPIITRDARISASGLKVIW